MGRILLQAPVFEAKLTGLVANTTYLIYTNAVDMIILVSKNLAQIKDIGKMSLQDLLTWLCGSDEEAGRAVFKQLKEQVSTQKTMRDLPIEIHLTSGAAGQPAWLSGIVLLTPEGTPSGMNLALRTYRPGVMPYEGLSDHEIGIVRFILKACGAEEFLFSNCWKDYANQYITLLYKLLTIQLGELSARQMISKLEEIASQKHFTIQVRSNLLEISGEPAPAEVRQALITLLQQAKGYAQGLLGQEILRREYENLEHKIDPSIYRIVQDFQLNSFAVE